MSKMAIKRRFIALRTAGERERRQNFIRVARWSICHLCYGHKLEHLGALTLQAVVAVESRGIQTNQRNTPFGGQMKFGGIGSAYKHVK